MTPDCHPHPRELEKREGIERESAEKGEDPAAHPGWGWWLCRPCGTWHQADKSPGAGNVMMEEHNAR